MTSASTHKFDDILEYMNHKDSRNEIDKIFGFDDNKSRVISMIEKKSHNTIT
jgi:hypothetical protein